MILLPIAPEVQTALVTGALLSLCAYLVHTTTRREDDRRHLEFWLLHADEASKEEIKLYQDRYTAEHERAEALEVELANANARIVAARQDLEGIHQVSLRLLGRTRP